MYIVLPRWPSRTRKLWSNEGRRGAVAPWKGRQGSSEGDRATKVTKVLIAYLNSFNDSISLSFLLDLFRTFGNRLHSLLLLKSSVGLTT